VGLSPACDKGTPGGVSVADGVALPTAATVDNAGLVDIVESTPIGEAVDSGVAVPDVQLVINATNRTVIASRGSQRSMRTVWCTPTSSE
jgi:hypothetical protein